VKYKLNSWTIVVIGLAATVLFFSGAYLALSHSGDRTPFETYSSSDDHMMGSNGWGMPMMGYRDYGERGYSGGPGYGASSEDREWSMYGMMGMYGMEECEEHMKEYEEEYRAMGDLVVVTGTIVGLDKESSIVEVLLDNNTVVAFRLARMYVDKSNGYIVFGGWFIDTLAEGQEVTITSFDKASMMGILPVISIEVDSSTYVVPYYYEIVEN